nr:MAG TPA: receptor binding complex [Caudoviricetes sp.]
MAQKIQVKRGLQAAVENLVLSPGEFAVALDTGNVYIGITSGKFWVNPPAAAAETAKTLETARELSLTGDVTSDAVSFDGSQNVSFTTMLATIAGLTAGDYAKVTVDKKGRVIAGKTLDAADIPTISKDKVSGLGTAASLNTGTAVGNVVAVGSDGKISSDLLPALAITDTFVVDSEAAMLALSVQKSDIAIRTDLGKSFILKATPATQLANWQELLSPESPIQSVNGKTGTVTLAASDVGAEPVLNNKTAKASVADNDGIVILDSAASNGTKKLLWSVIKSTLKTYFDGLYNKYTLPTMSASTKGGAKVGTGLVMSGEVLSVGDIDGGTF